MAGQSIAQFWADLGVRVQPNSIRNVDNLLNQIEARIKRFAAGQEALKLDFNNFIKFDPTRLRTSLQRTLDQVSRTTFFEIKNFRVDDAHLTAQLRAAMERASATTRFRPHVEARGMANEGGRHLRTGLGAGVGAGSALTLGRVYPAALALAGGAYGLSSLNQRNQAIQSAELTSQAVVEQAGGTAQQGTQAFNWLRQQGNRIGFNYLEAANDYNNVISGITGAGGTVAQGQDIFKGFSEYGRVNHIDTERQKRVFRALSQIAGKDKLMSEELTGQLAESLPGAVSLFAEAYQRQNGGNLTGSDSTTALLAAMKKGQVRGNILNTAAQIASERAAPSLAISARTSQSEQARFQNTVNDLVRLANQNGVESGYARLFKTFNDGLGESGNLVKSLSQGFDELTKKVRLLYLIPQSFTRMLEGRDSFITDLIGGENAESIRTSIKVITDSWNDLKKSFGETGWTDYLKTTLAELQGILNNIARFSAALAGASRYKQYLMENGTSEAIATVQAAGKFAATNREDTADLEKYNAEQQRLYPLRSELDAKYRNLDASSQVNGDVPVAPMLPTFDPIDAQGRVNGAIQRYTDPTLVQNQMQRDVTANTTNNNDNRVNVVLGDITIQTQATDSAGIASDFGQHVQNLMNNILSDTRIQYPSNGR